MRLLALILFVGVLLCAPTRALYAYNDSGIKLVVHCGENERARAIAKELIRRGYNLMDLDHSAERIAQTVVTHPASHKMQAEDLSRDLPGQQELREMLAKPGEHTFIIDLGCEGDKNKGMSDAIISAGVNSSTQEVNLAIYNTCGDLNVLQRVASKLVEDGFDLMKVVEAKRSPNGITSLVYKDIFLAAAEEIERYLPGEQFMKPAPTQQAAEDIAIVLGCSQLPPK